MQEIAMERRTSNRRSSRGGGRRAIDPPSGLTRVPMCPTCGKVDVALLAGEAEGGWWFVCLGCDYLWNQRQLASHPPDSPADSARLPATLMLWWKTVWGV